MKNIYVSHFSRFSKCIAALFAIVSFCLSADSVFGQYLRVDPGPTNICGSPNRCCQHFIFETGNTVDSLIILVDEDGCWDWTCFLNQTFTVVSQVGTSVTPTHTTKAGRGRIKLSFSPALTPSPANVQFDLCPTAGCTFHNRIYEDSSWFSGSVNAAQNGSFNACAGFQTDCLGCDNTILYWGVTDTCHRRACFKRKANASTGPLTIQIITIPHLPPCTGGLTGGCGSSTTHSTPAGWTSSDHTDSGGNIDTITASTSNNVAACDEICFDFPICGTAPYTFKIVEKNNPSPCLPLPAMVLKRAAGSRLPLMAKNNEPNYPNPVTRENDFRTIIPFMINESSEARITIVDESGKLVYKETESFNGGGKHFFFFTGKDLPTGRYYYTIESPLGMIIVNRTLLIVK